MNIKLKSLPVWSQFVSSLSQVFVQIFELSIQVPQNRRDQKSERQGQQKNTHEKTK